MVKRVLDLIIIDFFFLQKDTGEREKKSRNHDLLKCVPEWRFEIQSILMDVDIRFVDIVGFVDTFLAV